MSDPFWFWKLSISGKIIFIVFVITGFFGLDFYFKLDIAKKKDLLKQEMLHICSANEPCKNAVNSSFQECFNDNFDKSKPGHYTKFDAESFSECMNENAGVDYFKPIRLKKL